MESKHKSINIKTTNNRRLHKLTTAFRLMETFFFLAIISRFSSQLPSAVKLAGVYFRESNFSIFSPKFVFVIGNLIILILYLRSRVVDNSEDIGNSDLRYEYVKSCNQSVVNCTDLSCKKSPANRKISRSKSENPISVKCREEQTRGELRRSVTEISRSVNSGGPSAAEKSNVKDEQSCEDFRRTVEAFIARRQKILRDEEL